MNITYNNKAYTIPKPFDQCFMGAEPTKLMTIHNRFSDESFTQQCQLPAFAVAIYDTIIGAERVEDFSTVQKGLTWFQKNFVDEYYVLLDQQPSAHPMQSLHTSIGCAPGIKRI